MGQKNRPATTPDQADSHNARLGDLSGSAPGIPGPLGTLGSSERGIQLGLNLSDALAVVRESPSNTPADAVEKHLHHALASHDLESGRGPSGAIATAASNVAREIGPNWGTVLLATVIGANGQVLDVELLDAAGPGWTRVPRALFRALRGRTIPVSIAKNGVRVVTRLGAALRLPSGATSRVRVVSPTEPTQKYRDAPLNDSSIAQSPQGLAMPRLSFDVADIGQPRRKVVSVHTVSVTPL